MDQVFHFRIQEHGDFFSPFVPEQFQLLCLQVDAQSHFKLSHSLPQWPVCVFVCLCVAHTKAYTQSASGTQHKWIKMIGLLFAFFYPPI